MSSTKNPGRVAGFLYLLPVVATPFGEFFVRDRLIARGNAAATANNILASETQ